MALKTQMFKPCEVAGENKEQLNYKEGKDTMFVHGQTTVNFEICIMESIKKPITLIEK